MKEKETKFTAEDFFGEDYVEPEPLETDGYSFLNLEDLKKYLNKHNFCYAYLYDKSIEKHIVLIQTDKKDIVEEFEYDRWGIFKSMNPVCTGNDGVRCIVKSYISSSLMTDQVNTMVYHDGTRFFKNGK